METPKLKKKKVLKITFIKKKKNVLGGGPFQAKWTFFAKLKWKLFFFKINAHLGKKWLIKS